MKKSLLISILAFTLVFTTACFGGGDDEATETTDGGEVTEGGTDTPSEPTTY
jgi:hypothetical protein